MGYALPKRMGVSPARLWLLLTAAALCASPLAAAYDDNFYGQVSLRTFASRALERCVSVEV